MKTESENLSAQESLDIITGMIKLAKGNVRRNAFHFLLWGWVIVAANLGMYTLIKTGYSRPYIVWLITIPAWIISFYVGYRQAKAERITTHFDSISSRLWICFGISIFILIGFGSKINYQLNPLILTVSSIPTFMSGQIIQFRPLMYGGAALWVFGIIGFLSPYSIQPLVGAAAVFCCYLIPGYLLKNRKD
jgi:hypothetical protein